MKKTLFFIKRAIIDVIKPYRFGVSSNHLKDAQSPYGLDYSSDGMHAYYNLKDDKDGIIMMSHYIDHQSEETNYYSPVKIAHYALGAYNDYLKTKDSKYLVRFTNHIEFLFFNFTEINVGGRKCVVWTTPSTNSKYEISMHYISAIVQGLVISALSRAFLLYGDSKYQKLSERALMIFSVPVEEGGILADTQWGKIYEEYPCLPYSHVVNGFVFSLIGLYDCWKIGGISQAKALYDEGIASLIKVLPFWYIKRWSKYDLRDLTNGQKINLATHHYQWLHADLLRVVAEQTNDSTIQEYVRITEEQLKNKSYLLFVYLNKFYHLILKK